MNRSLPCRRLLFAMALAALQSNSSSGIEFTEIAPFSGPRGTLVRIAGEDFSPGQPYSVTVGGGAAEFVSASDSAVEFRIGPSSRSGAIVLSDAGSRFQAAQPFIITRAIQGVFNPPPQVDPSRYRILSGSRITLLEPGTRNLSALVQANLPSVLIALGEIGDPFYMKVITDGDASAVIDAESTAVALVFNTPGFQRLDQDIAAELLETIRAEARTAELSALIGQISRNGLQFIDDVRVEALVLSLTRSAIQSLDLLIESRASRNVALQNAANPSPPPELTLMRILNPAESVQPLGMRHVYEFKVENAGDEFPNHLRMKVEFRENRRTPLDAVIEVFSVSPATFQRGLDSIRTWEVRDSVQFLANVPLVAGFLRGELLFSEVDAFGATVEAILKSLTDPILPSRPNEFLIDKRRPALYMVQVYSGNVFWNKKNDPDGQYRLIQANDPRDQSQVALSANNTAVMVDLYGGTGGIEAVSGISGGYAESLLKAAIKAAEIYDGDADGLTDEELIDLGKASLTALAKKHGEEMLAQGADALAARGGAWVLGKKLVKGLNTLAQISDLGQATERTTALISPRYLSMERALLVLGNPFRPSITEFSPVEGLEGDAVRVWGHRFSTAPDQFKVSLCQIEALLPNPDDVVIRASLPLTPTFQSQTAVEFAIPANWDQTFTGNDAYICVESDGRRAFSSRPLLRIPTPVLSAVSATTLRRGDTLTLSGSEFREGVRVRFSAPGLAQPVDFVPDLVNDRELRLVLPGTASLPALDYSAAVVYRTKSSQGLPVRVERVVVPPSQLEAGTSIRVTAFDWSNNSGDDQISLFEAIALATGTLGRPATEFTEEARSRLGPEFRNHIRILTGPNDKGIVVPVTSPIPPLTPGTTVELGSIIFDGSALGAGDALIAASECEFSHFGVRNFKGNALVIPDGAYGVDIFDVQIENCGASGIVLRNAGAECRADLVTITDCAGSGLVVDNTDGFTIGASGAEIRNSGAHGLHLLNGSMDMAALLLKIDGAGASGIFLESGASHNLLTAEIIQNCGLHGIHLSGEGVRFNRLLNPNVANNLSDLTAEFDLSGLVVSNQGWGLVIEEGASFNTIGARSISQNTLGGARIVNSLTRMDSPSVCRGNFVGKRYRADRNNTSDNPILSLLFLNKGPGIHLGPGASENVVQGINLAGNQGDAVRIRGPQADRNLVAHIQTGTTAGITGQPVQILPNQGNCIHIIGPAVGNQIGLQDFLDARIRNRLSHSPQNGVLLEGPDLVATRIIHTDIGPAELNGIAIMNSVRATEIGGNLPEVNIRIEACKNAGIFITGEDTPFTRIVGTDIGDAIFTATAGAPANSGAYGIYLKDGVRACRIGQSGRIRQMRGLFVTGDGTRNESNRIRNSSVSGIVLDHCGGSLAGSGEMIEANVIQNNLIERNETGILIMNNSRNNLIGGERVGFRGAGLASSRFTEENNTISESRTAGIRIRDNILTNPAEQNRILGNSISYFAFDDAGAEFGIREGPPSGVGILVDGASTGNVIGGGMEFSNQLSGLRAGVYLDGVRANTLRGLEINARFASGYETIAGVVIRGGSNNRIDGPDNEPSLIAERIGSARQGGQLNPDNAGIVLIETSGNVIESSVIRQCRGDGILLIDSSGNTVGGMSPAHGNQITQNDRNGIRLTGPDCRNNVIRRNAIGTDLTGAGRLGNSMDGIRIEGGAHGNLAGGTFNGFGASSRIPLSAPNLIAYNLGHGVHVTGGGAVDNQISANQITENQLEGIHLASGGNLELRPPELFYDGNRVHGNANGLSPNSTVQIFSDPSNEGALLLAEAEVVGNTFSVIALPLPVYSSLTAVSIDGASGNTSPFSVATFSDPRLLAMARSDGGPPRDRAIAFAPGEHVVLSLAVRSQVDPVLVDSVAIKATGGLDETALAGVRIYEDIDKDGRPGPGDRLLGGPAVFNTNDGVASVVLHGAEVDPNEPRQWLITYATTASAPPGIRFSLDLSAPESVAARYFMPLSVVAPVQGAFPLEADRFLTSESLSMNYSDWRARHFPGQTANDGISGLGADPDNDGHPNLVEFALGLDPNIGLRTKTYEWFNENGRWVYEYRRDEDAGGVEFLVTQSPDLSLWQDAAPLVQSMETTGQGTGTLKVRHVLRESNPAPPRLFLRFQIRTQP